MKALLLKDWLVMKAQYKFYVLVFLFIGIIGLLSDTGYMNAYAMIIMSTVSTSLLQNDETCRWLQYADVTPLTRKQVVKEKYTMNLLLLTATCLLMAVFRLAAGLIHGNPAEAMTEMLSVICLFVTVGTLMTGVSFPLLFRLGMMKGKVIALVLYGVIGGIMAGGYVMLTMQWFLGGAEIHVPVLTVIAAVCLVVVYPVSYVLAVRWYARRELV